MDAKNVAVIVAASLGVVKLTLEAKGISGLTDGLINDIANGVAAVVVAVGIFRNNRKEK